MDLLKRELERKKKTVEKAKATSGGRRFFRAGDLRRQEEEEEEEKQAKYAASRKKRKLGSDQDDDEHTTTAALGSKKKKDKGSQKAKESETQEKESSASKKSQSESNEAVRLSSDEITKKLRAFGLPIKLFGESLEDRVKRLRKALDEQRKAQAGDAEMDEFRLGRGHGIRNTFLGKDKDDTTGAGEQAHVEETDAAKDDKETETKDDDDDLGDDSDPHKRVYKYFKGLLKGWEDDLVARPDSVKRSVAGRNETKTLKQCKDYIRPMFKLLKSRRMDESILTKLNRIVSFCLEEEFVKAHDTYIDISIGRAAWPIGVTMVGIHARTGRAKIESSNVAHVMNSELQRKYLTSVKRLMTYAQKKSAADPSKKVL